jgi:hypothetical protein
MYTVSSLIIAWMMCFFLLAHSTLTESERKKNVLSNRRTRILFAFILVAQIPLVINERDSVFRFLAKSLGSKSWLGDVFAAVALMAASTLLGALSVLTSATMRHVSGEKTKLVRITLICAAGVLGLSLAFVK